MQAINALPGLEEHVGAFLPTPSRTAGLARLKSFVPRAGQIYSKQRNYDFGAQHRNNVSVLSAWIRHRLVCEEEVLQAVLARHAMKNAEKFVQEVFWRGYFKGWLEQRPTVWRSYQIRLAGLLEEMTSHSSQFAAYEDAISGHTGIDGFDHWAKELVTTGYLHNHARMWFASIWIFTLRLPWELGADFFLRHLVDGDPASNTLSWRWVAGLHTKGKAYQARASNIAKYTGERFRPEFQLASDIAPLDEAIEHQLVPLSEKAHMPESDYLLLVTEEDGCLESFLIRPPVHVVGFEVTAGRSPLKRGPLAQQFCTGAIQDAVKRAASFFNADYSPNLGSKPEDILAIAQAARVNHVVSSYAPVGPVADQLKVVNSLLKDAGITLHQPRRPYDDLVWPNATKGFFALKKTIPSTLQKLGITTR